jgi:alkylated DNA repair protein alkB family protein 1
MGRKSKPIVPDASSFANQTALRAVERKYKNRHTPLDLSEVFDWTQYPSTLDPSAFYSVTSETLHDGDQSQCPPCAIQVQLSTSLPLLLQEQCLSNSSGSGPLETAEKTIGYVFPGYAGVIFIPNAVPIPVQKHFARRSLSDYAKPPNYSNIDAHWEIPAEGLWQPHLKTAPAHSFQTSNEADSRDSVIIPLKTKPPNDPTLNTYDAATPPVHLTPLSASQLLMRLRWCTLGYQYYWATKTYVKEKQYPFPEDLYQLSQSIAMATENVLPLNLDPEIESIVKDKVMWGTGFPGSQYHAQAGVLNFYGEKDALMAHVDRSEENMSAPLISVSIGSDCIFVIGGRTREDRPIPIRLRSGDVIVMAGPSRMAFHGVPRIIEQTLPDWVTQPSADASDPEWMQVLEYMKARQLRFNLNMRQVF